MKWWTSEHTFNDPWETVTQAAFRKYPNPLNKSVVAVDVVDRKLEKGVLKSHKLLTTEWNLPPWIAKITGLNTCHVSEHSDMDRRNKVLKLRSRNLTLINLVTVDEQMEYTPDPSDPKNKTKLVKTNVITVQGIPMSDYVEKIMKNTMAEKAQQGIAAMEGVISKIKDEAQDFTKAAEKTSKSISKAAQKEMSELQRKSIQIASESRSTSL